MAQSGFPAVRWQPRAGSSRTRALSSLHGRADEHVCGPARHLPGALRRSRRCSPPSRSPMRAARGGLRRASGARAGSAACDLRRLGGSRGAAHGSGVPAPARLSDALAGARPAGRPRCATRTCAPTCAVAPSSSWRRSARRSSCFAGWARKARPTIWPRPSRASNASSRSCLQTRDEAGRRRAAVRHCSCPTVTS